MAMCLFSILAVKVEEEFMNKNEDEYTTYRITEKGIIKMYYPYYCNDYLIYLDEKITTLNDTLGLQQSI